MIQTRRSLLKHATIAGAVAALSPGLSFARARSGEILYETLDDPTLRALVRTSVEAAQRAGASYADVRITHFRRRGDGSQGLREQESITAGVRALVNGYWGFASGPVWDNKELVRLADEAAQLARVSSGGKVKQTNLTPMPTIPDGTWTTPVKLDPFLLHPAQIRDAAEGLKEYAKSKPFYYGFTWGFQVIVVDKTFGSSEGAFFSQRTYDSNAGARYDMANGEKRKTATVLNERAGAGFEIFDEEKARNEIDRVNAEGFSTLPVIPVDVGRYETVYDGSSVASILGSTIGCASELDRALGFEANAGGTSYLNEPGAMVGAYALGNPLLTVHGNRTEAGGLATVKWDDEAVPTSVFPLVKNGVFQAFQTNRELGGIDAGNHADKARSASLTGSAYAPEAVYAPLIRTPNLQMAPGNDDCDLNELIAGVEKGVLFRGLSTSMDFQQLNGLGVGTNICFEIRKGRITAQVVNAGVLFRSPEFWKSLIRVGGTRSLGRYPFFSIKGEPMQAAVATMTCPAIICRDQTIIDFQRKA